MAELTPEYIARMEDVLALYEKPYDRKEPVVCLDEKPVSLHADVRPGRPARPGHVAKRDNEYERCGTANIFGVVEPKAGRHFTCATANRKAAQFARMIRTVVTAYPAARTIHLVMDNLNTHGETSLTNQFGRRTGHRLWRRLTVHYTPAHGSWLNQAEIELSLVARQCLGTRRMAQLAHLQAETRAWNTRANRRKTCIRWRFTRKDARTKFGYTKKLSRRSET
ncbi:MAG: IS630 family transposase [Gemmatimonadaceae bacterium]|nr:IS630 family transposase [Gemmatimonadaceae bacterium]